MRERATKEEDGMTKDADKGAGEDPLPWPRFEVYADPEYGGWGWQLVARNGVVVARGEGTHRTSRECEAAVNRIAHQICRAYD